MTSPVRLCVECNGSMPGKRPHAVYCSRRCKTIASDRRRLDDGIGNVVPACPPCNFGKHTSLAIEWRRRLDERREVMPDDSRSFVA